MQIVLKILFTIQYVIPIKKTTLLFTSLHCLISFVLNTLRSVSGALWHNSNPAVFSSFDSLSDKKFSITAKPFTSYYKKYSYSTFRKTICNWFKYMYECVIKYVHFWLRCLLIIHRINWLIDQSINYIIIVTIAFQVSTQKHNKREMASLPSFILKYSLDQVAIQTFCLCVYVCFSSSSSLQIMCI